jgi:hypothetical protein
MIFSENRLPIFRIMVRPYRDRTATPDLTARCSVIAREERFQARQDRRQPRAAARDRRGDRCAREIGAGLLERGARLLQLRLRYFALRLEDRKLLFGGGLVGLRRRVVGLRLQKIGRVLLRLLDGAGAGFDERRIAALLLLREGQRRLCLRCLFLSLIAIQA